MQFTQDEAECAKMELRRPCCDHRGSQARASCQLLSKGTRNELHLSSFRRSLADRRRAAEAAKSFRSKLGSGWDISRQDQSRRPEISSYALSLTGWFSRTRNLGTTDRRLGPSYRGLHRYL